MFKQIMLFFYVIFFSVDNGFSQSPSIDWQKCYGGPGSEGISYISPTNDGGFIACGISFSDVIGGDITEAPQNPDIWVIKINATGNLLWQKTFIGKKANSIKQTVDGGYIIAGVRNVIRGTTSSDDFWVSKLNSTGGIVWDKTYGGTNSDEAFQVSLAQAGGYIVAGQTMSSDLDVTVNHGNTDGWLIELDDLGSLVWQKSFGGSGDDVLLDVKATTDGGYIGSGGAHSIDGDVGPNPSPVLSAIWILKFDAAGNIVWKKLYGNGAAFSICLANDGGYAFVGDVLGNVNGITGSHGFEDYWVVRLDASGNFLWQSTLGGSFIDQPRHITQTADGGFVVAGSSLSVDGDVTGNHGNSDCWIAKVSAAGVLEWAKSLGGTNADGGSCVYQTNDLGYIVSGGSASNNNGDVGPNHGLDDFWIVKRAGNTVPVTLIGFDAIAKGQDVMCTWQTAQEQNSHHFTVERSEDAFHFELVAMVTAAGNSSLTLNYGCADKNILSSGREYLYYRLKTVNTDGSFSYSKLIKVKLKFTGTFSVYPNPVSDKIIVKFTTTYKEKAVVSIYNDAGLKVFEQELVVEKGNNSLQIESKLLAAGSYSLILKGKNQYVTRIIKIAL